MQCSPLSQVKDRITVGRPLPFNVRDANQALMLARGQIIGTQDQLLALFRRGALVDLEELQTAEDKIRRATPGELPGLWSACLDDLGNALNDSGDARFVDALDLCAPSAMALVERDKDLAIFQVLRQGANASTQYSVNHSMRTAIIAFLVAQRLGWASAETQRTFKAALTMNISVLELQGHLAQHDQPPTEEQMLAIKAHPEFSAEMLAMSGVKDQDWLTAVAQHHETADGQGYPRGLRDIHMIAALVRRADIYATKLSPRRTRQAMTADTAGRTMFMQEPGHPMTVALVKEFGVYPPGAFVRLASGELGMVARRGPTVTTPIVVVLTSAKGMQLTEPLLRDTHDRHFAIVSVVGEPQSNTNTSPDRLIAMVL